MEKWKSNKMFRTNVLIINDVINNYIVILEGEECSSKNILNTISITWTVKIIQYMDLPLNNHCSWFFQTE